MSKEKTCFGVTEKEFKKMNPKDFNVTIPKDNLQKTSDDFNKFLIRASKGFAKTLSKNKKMRDSL